MTMTRGQLVTHIKSLRERLVEMEKGHDKAGAALLAQSIKRHERTLAEMDSMEPPKPGSVYPTGPVDNGIAPGTPIRTRQSSGKMGGVVHVYHGNHKLSCRPNGRLVESTTVHAVDEPVTCVKCSKATVPYDTGTTPAPTPKSEGQQTPLVEHDPIGVDPPDPIPAMDRGEGAAYTPPDRSVTTGELFAMVLAGRVNADLPIRLSGFNGSSDATLGAMVSLDGALVIMAVD